MKVDIMPILRKERGRQELLICQPLLLSDTIMKEFLFKKEFYVQKN